MWIIPLIALALGAGMTLVVVARRGPQQVRFSLRVAPSRFQVAIPGQRILVLVSVENQGETDAPVEISASASGATVAVEQPSVREGRSVEVRVVPTGLERVSITIRGERADLSRERTIEIEVLEGEDQLLPHASELRARFVAWLASERPELGIEAGTEWTGTIVQPYVLEVSHYLFLSESWEMGLSWHIMIAPYDWARIYLRQRTEVAPTEAFEISSVSDPASEPLPIAPPEEVDR